MPETDPIEEKLTLPTREELIAILREARRHGISSSTRGRELKGYEKQADAIIAISPKFAEPSEPAAAANALQPLHEGKSAREWAVAWKNLCVERDTIFAAANNTYNHMAHEKDAEIARVMAADLENQRMYTRKLNNKDAEIAVLKKERDASREVLLLVDASMTAREKAVDIAALAASKQWEQLVEMATAARPTATGTEYSYPMDGSVRATILALRDALKSATPKPIISDKEEVCLVHVERGIAGGFATSGGAIETVAHALRRIVTGTPLVETPKPMGDLLTPEERSWYERNWQRLVQEKGNAGELISIIDHLAPSPTKPARTEAEIRSDLTDWAIDCIPRDNDPQAYEARDALLKELDAAGKVGA